LRKLASPVFVMTATPHITDAGFDLKISPIDNDKVIIDSQYRILIYNDADPKVVVKDMGPYVFSSTNKVQSILIPAETGVIEGGHEYFVQVYAARDMNNEGLPLINIETVHTNAGANAVNVMNGNDANGVPYFIRTLAVTTLPDDAVMVGDVWTQKGVNNTIRLNFEGAVRMDKVTSIQYTIYSSDASYTYTSNGAVPITISMDNSVSPAMAYVVLMQPQLTAKNLYYITLDLLDSTNRVVGSASTTYRVS
jgi:hypothetical protein